METNVHNNVNDEIEVVEVDNETEASNMTTLEQTKKQDPISGFVKGFVDYVKENPGVVAANAVSYILGHRRGFKKGFKLGKKAGREAIRSKMWFYNEDNNQHWNLADSILAGNVNSIETFTKDETDVYEAVERFRKEFTNPTSRRYKDAVEAAMETVKVETF